MDFKEIIKKDMLRLEKNNKKVFYIKDKDVEFDFNNKGIQNGKFIFKKNTNNFSFKNAKISELNLISNGDLKKIELDNLLIHLELTIGFNVIPENIEINIKHCNINGGFFLNTLSNFSLNVKNSIIKDSSFLNRVQSYENSNINIEKSYIEIEEKIKSKLKTKDKLLPIDSNENEYKYYYKELINDNFNDFIYFSLFYSSVYGNLIFKAKKEDVSFNKYGKLIPKKVIFTGLSLNHNNNEYYKVHDCKVIMYPSVYGTFIEKENVNLEEKYDIYNNFSYFNFMTDNIKDFKNKTIEKELENI